MLFEVTLKLNSGKFQTSQINASSAKEAEQYVLGNEPNADYTVRVKYLSPHLPTKKLIV